MKNIFKFFRAFLTVVLAAALTGCLNEEQLESADAGLHIKVFFPTKVVAGQPMTINGSGFSEVTEVVFPNGEEGIVVTDFQIVSNDMIRVDAPAGISAEGGKIIVRTEAGEQVESPLPLTLGNTVVTGYSAEEGVEVEGGSQMTIYGTDLEFVNKIEMLDADGNPQYVEDELFNRKGTDHIIFTVPRKVFEGEFQGKVYTIDGKTFLMPMLTYKPASDGGYWDTVETVLWENPDPAGVGSVSWSGQYRFGLEGKDGNSECIATFPAETWDIIKNGTFILKFAPAADAYQIRATTGWWSFDGEGAHDIHNGDERIIDNGDGTFSLTYTISEEPLKSGIYDLIDDQHLLFTGSGYTPLKLYTTEEVWVEGGGHMEIVKNSIWKNDGSLGEGTWGNTYRFALEGKNGGDASVELPAELWEKLKTGPFNLLVQPVADWWQIRVLTGWWQGQWPTADDSGAGDINAGWTDIVVDNGDGTFTVTIDLTGHAILDLLDEQNLLFAGSGFQILEIYTTEEVWVGGGGEPEPVEVVLWEGEAIADDWGNQPNILTDGGVELQEAGAQPGQTIYFYMEPIDPSVPWFLELVEGHWSGVTYLTLCAVGADTQSGKFTEYDLDANGGRAALEITQEMLDTAYVQQWWGGTFIANGDNLKITKVTLL